MRADDPRVAHQVKSVLEFEVFAHAAWPLVEHEWLRLVGFHRLDARQRSFRCIELLLAERFRLEDYVSVVGGKLLLRPHEL